MIALGLLAREAQESAFRNAKLVIIEGRSALEDAFNPGALPADPTVKQ